MVGQCSLCHESQTELALYSAPQSAIAGTEDGADEGTLFVEQMEDALALPGAGLPTHSLKHLSMAVVDQNCSFMAGSES